MTDPESQKDESATDLTQLTDLTDEELEKVAGGVKLAAAALHFVPPDPCIPPDPVRNGIDAAVPPGPPNLNGIVSPR